MEVSAKFIISTLLIIVFLVVTVSGFMLLFELSKATHHFIKQLHIISGIIMVILVVIHFIGNYTLYKNESKIFFE